MWERTRLAGGSLVLLVGVVCGLAACAEPANTAESQPGEGEGEVEGGEPTEGSGSEGEGEPEGVGDDNQQPVLRRIGNRQVVAGKQLLIELQAVDPDGDPVTYRVYGTLPPGAKFDAQTGRFSWTPAEDLVGKIYYLTFGAGDGRTEALETVQLKVVSAEAENQPPRFVQVGDQTLRVGQPFELQLEATDPEGAALTFSLRGEVPEGVTLTPKGLLTWTPTPAQAGQRFELFLEVSDGKARDEMELRCVVEDEGGQVNRPPQLNPIGNRSWNVGEKLTILVTATDPDGDEVTYSIAAGTQPAGASFKPSPRGSGYLFQWTPTPDQDHQSFTVVFEAQDVRPASNDSLTDREEVLITIGGGGEGEGEGEPEGAEGEGAEGEGAEEEGAVGEGEGAVGCTEDPHEDNDDWNGAAPLPLGRHEGLRICGRDRDWFLVRVDAGVELTVRALFRAADGDLDLAVFRDDPGQALGFSAGSEDNEEVVLPRVEGGEYRLMLYAAAGEVDLPYVLEVTAGGAPACVEDPGEPNDTTALATRITPGETVQARICPEDVDVYRFEAQAGQEISAELNFVHADGDLDLELWGPRGQSLGYSDGLTDQERITFTATQTGTHTLEVFSWNAVDSAYTLSVTLSQAESCPADRLEPDNDANHANYLEAELRGLTACTDPDWFWVEVGAGTLWYVFVETDEPAALGLVAYAEDEVTELGTGQTTEGGVDLLVEAVVGELFFVVVTGQGTGVDYSLDIIAD